MEIQKTVFENGFAELTLSDGTEGGEVIAVRVRQEPKTEDHYILLQLAILRAARDAVGAEIQRLSRLCDQTL